MLRLLSSAWQVYDHFLHSNVTVRVVELPLAFEYLAHILISSPIKFHVTRAMRLHAKILYFFDQNLTWTDFEGNLMANLFFLLPMS